MHGDLTRNEYEDLLKQAEAAMENAYTPYSGFKVGAALLLADGTVVTGCNIENGAYSPTICAERTAISKAVSEGRKDFRAIAVACSADVPAYPCGVCRQVISEFSDDIKIVVGSTAKGILEIYGIAELLPHAFKL